ncbi:MAG TPA: hypothetical protein VF668_21430 [Pyrinomonadaceae bacterium]|jgi:hypothetical protein
MNTQTANELRRKGAAFCLLAAPLLMLAGDALRLWAGARHTWLVTFKLAFALFVGAALALVRLSGERAERAALLGGALAVVGCLAGVGIVTAGAVLDSLETAGLDEHATRAVEAAFARDGVGGYILLYPLPGLAFPLGFLVLAYALRRARAATTAAAALIAAGALLFPVGRIGGFGWAVIGSGLAMTLGLGHVALGVLRAGAAGRRRLPEPAEAHAASAT